MGFPLDNELLDWLLVISSSWMVAVAGQLRSSGRLLVLLAALWLACLTCCCVIFLAVLSPISFLSKNSLTKSLVSHCVCARLKNGSSVWDNPLVSLSFSYEADGLPRKAFLYYLVWSLGGGAYTRDCPPQDTSWLMSEDLHDLKKKQTKKTVQSSWERGEERRARGESEG